MPGIEVDWVSLEAAFESHAPDIRTYLVRTTGALFNAALGDEAAQRRVLEEREQLVEVEPVPSREQYRMMERFIDTVTHAQLKERLKDSIVGKGAFRRFKDVLGRFPEERKRWFAYRDVLLHRFILEWMKTHRLEVSEIPAWPLEPPSTPSADVREGEPEHDVTADGAADERQEVAALRAYLLAWSRAHAEEYHYLFGPHAFDRLAQDMAQEFTLFRRRNGDAEEQP